MNRFGRFFVATAALTASLAAAQTAHLPAPDKDGWIHLFDGKNMADWFYVMNGTQPPGVASVQQKFPGKEFSIVKGDTIAAYSGNPHGQIYFNQVFSRYHMRYEMHFPGNQGNCGMLIHVQPNDPLTMGFPRAIESQGDPSQGMGEVWPIGDVWVTVKASKGTKAPYRYDANGTDVIYGGADWSHRVIEGKDGWGKPDYTTLSKATGWVTQEVDAYAGDSVIDIVQDTVRIKYRDPRVSSGGTANNVTKHLTTGMVGWQAEGAVTWYRNIEVRLLPGDPLYQTVYARWNEERTIRPLPARKTLFLKDGILALREDGSGAKPLFDASGRLLAGFGPLLPAVARP